MQQMTLTKKDFYIIYQTNLIAAKGQLDVVETLCKEKRAFFYIFQNNQARNKKAESEYNACKRIYALLLGNWYEIILYRIIYDKSSAAFSETEIEQINCEKSISKKWNLVYTISRNKAENTFPISELPDFSIYFSSDYFKEIEELIMMRNRLSHGQWDIQLNSNKSNIRGLNFFIKYKNFAELRLLRNKLDKMSLIIETLVASKDKTESTFKNRLIQLKTEIDIIDRRINNADDKKAADRKIRLIEKKLKKISRKFDQSEQQN